MVIQYPNSLSCQNHGITALLGVSQYCKGDHVATANSENSESVNALETHLASHALMIHITRDSSLVHTPPYLKTNLVYTLCDFDHE